MIKFKENLEETRRDSEQGFKVNKRVADANLITIWKKNNKGGYMRYGESLR